jgi:hypothetical protein
MRISFTGPNPQRPEVMAAALSYMGTQPAEAAPTITSWQRFHSRHNFQSQRKISQTTKADCAICRASFVL